MRGLALERSIIIHFGLRSKAKKIMIKIEAERPFLYPISDEEMQTIIDNENDPEIKKNIGGIR